MIHVRVKVFFSDIITIIGPLKELFRMIQFEGILNKCVLIFSNIICQLFYMTGPACKFSQFD